MESAFGGAVLLSFSLRSQNRNKKSSGPDKHRDGSFLSRHRPDAQVALQQVPILQNDLDKVMKMNYNSKGKVELHSELCGKLIRPFTQLNEQTQS